MQNKNKCEFKDDKASVWGQCDSIVNKLLALHAAYMGSIPDSTYHPWFNLDVLTPTNASYYW